MAMANHPRNPLLLINFIIYCENDFVNRIIKHSEKIIHNAKHQGNIDEKRRDYAISLLVLLFCICIMKRIICRRTGCKIFFSQIYNKCIYINVDP